jgi:hypothetical protein
MRAQKGRIRDAAPASRCSFANATITVPCFAGMKRPQQDRRYQAITPVLAGKSPLPRPIPLLSPRTNGARTAALGSALHLDL